MMCKDQVEQDHSQDASRATTRGGCKGKGKNVRPRAPVSVKAAQGKGTSRKVPPRPSPPPSGEEISGSCHDTSPEVGSLRPGAAVEVSIGPHAGCSAVVLLVVGKGREMRWKVRLEDGVVTWASVVKSAVGGAPLAKETSSSPGPDREVLLEDRRAAREAKMREKAERQRAELQRRREHYASLRSADVNAIAWGQAKEINYISGGSGGVLLVDLGDECVALKPQGKYAAAELLAQHLAPHCFARRQPWRLGCTAVRRARVRARPPPDGCGGAVSI